MIRKSLLLLALPLLFAVACAWLGPASGYQTKLLTPDGGSVQTPKDGSIENITVSKAVRSKDGSTSTYSFHADKIQYGVNSNAVSGEAAIYKTILPNGVEGVINSTGAAVGAGIGAAAKTAVKP